MRHKYRIYMILFVTLFLNVLFTNNIRAQFSLYGTPQIVNYTKRVYNADSRTWAIAQDKKGILYFANGSGLLSYSGSSWELHKLPDNQTVRSVAIDEDGKIYVAGFSEFGYWDAIPNGPLQYHSLNHLITKPKFKNEEIWKITPTSNGIFFQSFSSVYRFYKNKVTPIDLPGNIMMLFSVRGKEYIQVFNVGLHIINKDNSLSIVAGSQLLNDKKVISILPFFNNTLLIGTLKNGFYIYDGNSFREWNNQTNDYIKANDLNAGLQLDEDRYVFGTIQNGIIVSNNEGKILFQINRAKGLQNNTILALYKDRSGNIVAALDNGIDYICINSPLLFFKDFEGHLGATYTAFLHGENLYLGSNHGLFSAIFQNADVPKISSVSKIGTLREQVWNLNFMQGELLCGNNNGTYSVKDGHASKISDVPGGWLVKKLKIDTSFLIQGSYIGLALYHKNRADHWSFLKLIDSAQNIPAKNFIQDSLGNIWIEHVNKGIFQTRINKDLSMKPLEKIKITEENAGVLSTLFVYNNKPYIRSGEAIYTFNYDKEVFIKDDLLSLEFKPYLKADRIIDQERYLWIIQNNHSLIMIDKTNKHMESIAWNQANFALINSFQNIVALSENKYLLCGEDGFLIYNQEFSNSNKLGTSLFFKSLNILTDSEYTFERKTIENGRIPYKNNSLQFNVAYPVFDRDVLFRYSLTNSENKSHWTHWTSNPIKEFTNLNPGKYFLKIQSDQNDFILKYEFMVLPPWYGSIIAFIFYFLFLLLIIYFIYKYIKRRIARQNEWLRLHHERRLLEERRKYEQLTLIKQQEQLEREVIIKSEDIARSAMKLIKNKKALQKLKTGLIQLKSENTGNNSTFQIQKLTRQIERLLEDDQQERDLFENGFSRVHEEFFKQLNTRYSQLTPQDLKLAAYLRMNLSSKEIAPLLDISIRGVEIKRYRLRKKMNIHSDENLNDFMMRI